ncbi:MAG TPA: DNA-binding transcriptional regulator [Alteraurantiacibacter sp.]|jgi:IclR family mhp operon transcriptional activator
MSRETRIQKNDSIRSVERAIDVLQALNRRPLSTLHDLHCETGLPKPSIVRLLRTLEAKGLAAQSSSYGSYQLLGRVKSLASGFHHEPEIVEAAEDIMIEFTRREGWPLSMALFDVNAVVVRACTIRFTSLSLEHSSLNRRLSLVTHALGRAYLAYSTPNEQAILRAILKDSTDPDDAPAHDEEAMDRMVREVRERGYAMRDPTVNPRSSTFAVPIVEGGRAVASLGFTWISAAMTGEQAVRKYLEPLYAAAEAISASLGGCRPAPSTSGRELVDH